LLFIDEEKLSQRIDEVWYAALDVETTGLSFHDDKIVEIGIVVWKCGEKIKEFTTLLNPGKEISIYSYRVHKISDDMVKKAPTFLEIVDEVENLLKDTVLIGHNVLSVDLSFLNKELKEAGRRPLYLPFIDTYVLYRRLFPAKNRRSLKSFGEALGIKVNTVHRALPDARLTMKIWQKLVEKFRRDGLKTLKELDMRGLLNGKLKEKARLILELAKIYGRIKIVYYSPYNGRTVREIEPMGVRGNKIDAYCHLREDFRTFDLNRVKEICPPKPLDHSK
jgi:DNA polymerase III epsilon subunit family exonuclease